ncbi:hypothetical protein BME96_08940 [Virgibacillus halodenitrificans]|uniref:Uncharacterized protein n=1 Tax=Virgibacillus halodenitrificans TaxID=1482 RepID=A0AAC9IYR3_VIRHA|nr:hypothetical protein [Virgibacillus halodenitrificans]APC48286.1 hypothetical protein BME96_08940 [Virgibacillus halodenitrificans]
MLIIGITTLLVALYTGLVVGTYKKFRQNGINFIGKAKLVFPFIPISLIFLHLFWAITSLFKSNKQSIYLFKMVLFKYPVVVGMIIELMLENAALRISENDKIVKMKRKTNRKKAIRKKKSIELRDMPQYSSQKKIYHAYKSLVSSSAV